MWHGSPAPFSTDIATDNVAYQAVPRISRATASPEWRLLTHLNHSQVAADATGRILSVAWESVATAPISLTKA